MTHVKERGRTARAARKAEEPADGDLGLSVSARGKSDTRNEDGNAAWSPSFFRTGYLVATAREAPSGGSICLEIAGLVILA